MRGVFVLARQQVTGLLASVDKAFRERVWLLLDTMVELGEQLVDERSSYLTDGEITDHEKTHEADLHFTWLGVKALQQSGITSSDEIITEDVAGLSRPAIVSATWVGDFVDHTVSFRKQGRTDHGSALMVMGGSNLASLYLMPGRQRLYLAIAGLGAWLWVEGDALKGVQVQRSFGEAIMRVPRKGIPVEFKPHFQCIQQRFQDRNYRVGGGAELAAWDILSIAEGTGPLAYFYVGKPHDWLGAAAIAHVAGAKVTLCQWDAQAQVLLSEVPVFPVNAQLLEQARQKVRVPFLVEWVG